MKFLTRKASNVRTEKRERAWLRLWDRYQMHLREIRPQLSTGWRKIAATVFHDTEVFSFGPVLDKEFIINIDMNPGWKSQPLFICSLHFRKVRRFDVPQRVQGDWLIHDEVDITSKGAGVWRALLRRSAFRIEADEVAYVINHEPLR